MSKFNLSICFILTAVILTACDSPRDRRRAFRSNSDGVSTTGGVTVLPSGSEQVRDNPTPTPSPNDPTPAPQNEIPSEIDHCSWSTDGQTGFSETHAHLGMHTICQSRCNKNDVYIQVNVPVTDAQVCVIPTHNSNGSSVYVGEPRCLLLQDNKKIYKVSLLNNRPGFANFPITGAMVMKDKAYFYGAPFYQYLLSPDAYLFCSQFLDQYNDASYCQAFKAVGQYVPKEFPANQSCSI